MNHTYYAINEESGTTNDIVYMIIAVYRDETLLSKERVTRLLDGCWDFCIDFIEGNYTAFDLIADIAGEDRAAWHIEEDCFDACWDAPNEPIDILFPTEYRMTAEEKQAGRDILNKNVAEYLAKPLIIAPAIKHHCLRHSER